MDLSKTVTAAPLTLPRLTQTRSCTTLRDLPTMECVSDLLGQLDRTMSAFREAEASLRAPKGPRIPKASDHWTPPRPKPDKELIKQQMGSVKAPFAPYLKVAGSAFEAYPPRLRGEGMEPRTQSRLLMPERSYAKLPAQIRYHAQSEPISEPTDDMCHESHKKWLQQHYKTRDRHIYEVFYALQRADAAKDSIAAIARKRHMAAEVEERSAATTNGFSNTAKGAIGKVRGKLKAATMLKKLSHGAGYDPLADEEKKAKAKLKKCESAPCIRLVEPKPDGEVTHVKRWQGPDQPLRYLRSSTPWIEYDETEELIRKGRMTRH